MSGGDNRLVSSLEGSRRGRRRGIGRIGGESRRTGGGKGEERGRRWGENGRRVGGEGERIGEEGEDKVGKRKIGERKYLV